MTNKKTTKKLTKREREAVLRRYNIQTVLFWVGPMIGAVFSSVFMLFLNWYYHNPMLYGGDIHTRYEPILFDGFILNAVILWLVCGLKYTLFLALSRVVMNRLDSKVRSSLLTIVTTLLVAFDLFIITRAMLPLVDQGFAFLALIYYSFPAMLVAFMVVLCAGASNSKAMRRLSGNQPGKKKEHYEDDGF